MILHQRPLRTIFDILSLKTLPIPVAEGSKPWFCGHSPADIVGSNPAGMDILCCKVETSAISRSLVQSLNNRVTFCLLCIILKNKKAMTIVGLQPDIKKKSLTNFPVLTTDIILRGPNILFRIDLFFSSFP